MGEKAHRSAAPARVAVYVVTLSDTRDEANDHSSAAIRAALEAAGHEVRGWCIVREEPELLERELTALLELPDSDALVVNGGTGLAPRDLAYDVLARLYEKPIPGFGEMFRALSFQQIGSAAMLSRASAGIARGKLVFSIPGSPGAVRLALERLILPEIGHMVGELRRGRETPS